MDKTEYRMKLDEINRLVEAQDYEGALEIADAIEWKRVKSVRTLCMVADIYEVNGELEESMRILQLAYKRSSVGKMILYRQVELALKMNDYDGALKYYNHYLETASNDTSKYILKYKIYKAKKAPVEEQIAILEEYKEKEYTERWVYELAKLYKKAGEKNKCIETCDDLILWFGEGKYVAKAMEMKMEYVPLSPAQKIKYDQYKSEKKNTVKTIEQVVTKAMTEETAKETKEEAVAEENPTTSEADVKVNVEFPELPEIPAVREPQIQIDTAQLQEKLAKSFQEVLAGLNRTKVVNAFEALGRATGSELPVEEPQEEENIEGYQIADLEPEAANEGKISAEKSEEIVERIVVPEAPVKEEKIEEKPEDKEITSIHDVDLEALFAETSGEFLKEMSDVQEESQEEEFPVESEVEDVAEEVKSEEVEPEETFIMPEIEMSVVEEILAEAEKKDSEPEETTAENDGVVVDESAEEKASEAAIMPVDDVQNESAEVAMAAFEASLLEGLDGLELEEEKSEESREEEIILEAGEEEEPQVEEVVLEAGEEEEPQVEEVVLEAEEEEELQIEEVVLEAEEEEEPQVEEVVLEAEEEEELQIEEVVLEVEEEEPQSEEESFLPEIDLNLVLEMTEDETEEEKTPEISEVESSETEESKKEDEEQEEVVVQPISIEELEQEESSVVEEREPETPEEKRMRILNDTRPERLSDSQKRLFSYFSKVPGMDEQILDAINGVYAYANEKTSRRGNIAIMGSHGTGKTRLSEGLVKAICRELGLEAAKYANLDASDINSKDPATVIAKMAGGFLLIERAGHMMADTIEKLSKAMEFRTDSMILIIEDDKTSMRKLLADYPKFAEKFETVISIPVFTNDELVTFARTYAKENGYRMDEMGVLALYTLIGDNQREDEPITIGKVKEMVDGAIQRAGGIRRKISKRRRDVDGRILLYEKDFDL